MTSVEELDAKKDGASFDIVAENLAKMRELFPDVFTEGCVDFDRLRDALGDYVDDRQERYSFTWHGKSTARRIAQTPSTGTLRPCPEESVGWESAENLFLEGDNLEVLKLLQKSYYGRVKMIYIDPPYNTGKEFIYPDKYQDNLDTYLRYTRQVTDEGFKVSANPETSGRYHTNWLNMMYPRLRLARNLLTQDGVIFISIDDHEVSNLREMCDEIFGEENWVSQITVQVNPRGRHLDQFVAKTHEYVLVYARNIDEPTTLIGLPKQGRMLEEYRKEDAKGKYRELELRNRNPAFNSRTRPNLFYPLYANPSDGSIVTEPDTVHAVEILPRNSEGADSCWTWGVTKAASNGDLLVGRQVGDGGWRVFRKDYLIKEGQTSETLPKTVWLESEFNHDYGKKAIQELLGANVMDFPKSPMLIQRMVQLGASQEDIVLDFFAGSCATADAVSRMNQQDGGARRFVMVQLPEPCDESSNAYAAGFKTIAEIGKERIRRVLSRVDQGQSEPCSDAGFKTFKLDSSNIRKWDPSSHDLERTLLDSVNNVIEDRSKLDVLYELILKLGLDLSIPVDVVSIAEKDVFVLGSGALVVCLDRDVPLALVEGIVDVRHRLRPQVMRVVFTDSSFANDVAKTNAIEVLRQAGINDVKCI